MVKTQDHGVRYFHLSDREFGLQLPYVSRIGTASSDDREAQQAAAKLVIGGRRYAILAILFIPLGVIGVVVGWLMNQHWLGAAAFSGCIVVALLLRTRSNWLSWKVHDADEAIGIPIPADRADDIVRLGGPFLRAASKIRREKAVGDRLRLGDPLWRMYERHFTELDTEFLGLLYQMRTTWLAGDLERWRALPDRMESVSKWMDTLDTDLRLDMIHRLTLEDD